MKPTESQNRAPIVFIVLLVAQLLTMSLHARAQAQQQSLSRTALLAVLYPLQKGTAWVTSSIGGVWFGYLNLRGVRTENQRLQAEINRLQQERMVVQEEVAAARRYRELLKLKESVGVPSVAATVIGRDGNPWYQQIVIDQGLIAGVRLYQIVITPQGVVGRVVGVGPTCAVVQLITDGTSGVGAMLSDTRVNGELKGRNGPQCQLASITGLVNVRVGEAVLTSGLEGWYPKGMLLGYVSQVQLGSGAALHQITVQPAAQLDRLEEVLVLLAKPPDIQITETVKK